LVGRVNSQPFLHFVSSGCGLQLPVVASNFRFTFEILLK
jgi:hypothetical protein